MAADANNLIWVDMEMSGLDPVIERVLEVAIVITDTQLNTVAEGPVVVVHQSNAVLDAMDAWNKNTHAKSGLIERVKASRVGETEADATLVEFLKQHVPAGVSPLCGNSVHQDRRFMVKYLPGFEAHFHYRNLDVSTLKELMRRWKPELAAGMTKHGRHEALADIYESIEELKYYREHFLKL
ncbi:MAG: oligoribonuclease [Burkholderiales bacterium]